MVIKARKSNKYIYYIVFLLLLVVVFSILFGCCNRKINENFEATQLLTSTEKELFNNIKDGTLSDTDIQGLIDGGKINQNLINKFLNNLESTGYVKDLLTTPTPANINKIMPKVSNVALNGVNNESKSNTPLQPSKPISNKLNNAPSIPITAPATAIAPVPTPTNISPKQIEEKPTNLTQIAMPLEKPTGTLIYEPFANYGSYGCSLTCTNGCNKK